MNFFESKFFQNNGSIFSIAQINDSFSQEKGSFRWCKRLVNNLNIFGVIASLVFVLMSFISAGANANTLDIEVYSPSTSDDGNYSVEFSVISGGSGPYGGVIEQDHLGNEEWLFMWGYGCAPGFCTYSSSNGVHTLTFTNKPPGIYSYGVISADPWGGEYWGSAGSVTVGAPELDSLADQSNFTYQVRRGDINSDGDQDLYIKRTTGGDPDDGALYETILQQNNDGTFSPLNATSAQLNVGSSWSTVAVNIDLKDFNLDGYIDLLIEGVGSVVSGANDQIAFSSGAPFNRKPISVTEISEGIEKFYLNSYGWVSDPDYFDQYFITVPYVGYVLNCGLYYVYSYGEYWLQYGCYVQYFSGTISGYDGNYVTSDALEFTELLGDFWNLDPETVVSQSVVSGVQMSFNDVVGLPSGFDPQINDDACYTNPISTVSCGAVGIVVGIFYGIILTAEAIDGLFDSVETEKEKIAEEDRPPCVTVTGRVVPVGTIGYRPLDVLPDDVIQHGIKGSHYNIAVANQNPYNGQCFWAPSGAVKPEDLPTGAVPMEPFVIPSV